MTPIGPDHGGCVVILTSLCIKRLGDRAAVSAQGAVVLGNLSEPQPDLMVLAGTVERYRHRHPRAEDVLLLIEVSDSTLRFDGKVKLPAYARAGVVEVWIVDLKGTAVEIHRRPTPEGYAFTERRRRGDTVSPEAVPDLVLTVDEILG